MNDKEKNQKPGNGAPAGPARRQRRNQRRKDGNKNNGKPVVKFTGVNNELKGKVISKTHNKPLAQQFDALLKAIITHAGSGETEGKDVCFWIPKGDVPKGEIWRYKKMQNILRRERTPDGLH